LAQISAGGAVKDLWHCVSMTGRHRSSNQQSTNYNVVPSEHSTTTGGPTDPRALGFVKAAYGVKETLDLLSVGRTALYAAVKRGELTPVKFGKKTLFYAVDLAAFLMSLKDHRGVRSRY
jgi:hypothetical protein